MTSFTGRRNWILAALGILALASALAWFVPAGFGRGGPKRILLVMAPQAECEGINPKQRLGIMLLLKDHLEIAGRLPIREVEAASAPRLADSACLNVAAERSGSSLRFVAAWILPDGRKESLDTGFRSPADAFGSILNLVGARKGAPGNLLTKDPVRFFELAELTGWVSDTDLPDAVKRGEDLVALEPDCASGHLAGAQNRNRFLNQRNVGDMEAHSACMDQFRKVLYLVPHYPRAVSYFAVRLTDRASQREALDLLGSALRARPWADQLYLALAYSARTCGLLDLALKAHRKRGSLAGPPSSLDRSVENALFYSGDWTGFAKSLDPGGEALVDPLRDFYRGYMSLAQGRAEEAMAFFKRAQEPSNRYPQFQQLARVFHFHFTDRKDEALGFLREIRTQRSSLRISDGEFTFKLAEAFALLGQREEAIDTAQRASAQGFGCTRWFESSPYMRPVRSHPRYVVLLNRLKERQTLLEARYPSGKFGL